MQGPIVARHFAHLPEAFCAPETVVHHTAKHLIVQAITDWRSGSGPQPSIGRPCSLCHGSIYQPVPPKITDARVEHRLPDGLVADVPLMAGDTLAAVVEIFVSHAVEAESTACSAVQSHQAQTRRRAPPWRRPTPRREWSRRR